MSNDVPVIRELPKNLHMAAPDYIPEDQRASFNGFRRPDGRVLPNVPALPAVHDSEQVLRAQNAGVDLNACTLQPSGDAHGFKLVYAIDVMHPRAIATRPWGQAGHRPG